jgi:alpha-tubulin suppressor-like RCC1 family protein
MLIRQWVGARWGGVSKTGLVAWALLACVGWAGCVGTETGNPGRDKGTVTLDAYSSEPSVVSVGPAGRGSVLNVAKAWVSVDTIELRGCEADTVLARTGSLSGEIVNGTLQGKFALPNKAVCGLDVVMQGKTRPQLPEAPELAQGAAYVVQGQRADGVPVRLVSKLAQTVSFRGSRPLLQEELAPVIAAAFDMMVWFGAVDLAAAVISETGEILIDEANNVPLLEQVQAQVLNSLVVTDSGDPLLSSRLVRGLSASTNLSNVVRVSWFAPTWTLGLTGYVVLRDGAEWTRVPAEITTVDDPDATPATLAAPLNVTATVGTLQSGVALSWQPAAQGGVASHQYTVRTEYADNTADNTRADGSASPPDDLSEPVTGSRAGEVTDYEFSRDDGVSWQSAGLVIGVQDTEAPRAGVRLIAPTVTPDLARGLIRLELPAAPEINTPPSATYRVRARVGSTAGPASEPILGRRAAGNGGDVLIQWQRSLTGVDGPYQDVVGVTGRVWFDATAPLDVPVYYRARPVVQAGDTSWVEPSPTTSAPAQVFGYKSVSTGGYHTCGVRSDDRILCWGYNGDGQAPTTPSTDTFKSVSAGGNHTCGLRSDDRILCWGDHLLGQAPTTPSTDTFKSVSAGGNHTCGLRSDDRILCWGDNTYGQAPTAPSADTFKSVSAGGNHTCGLRSDDRILCWGSNTSGQAPTAPSADTFKSISAGGSHTCGVRMDDRVICWGDDLYFQVSSAPGTDTFKSVSAGTYSSCGVRSDDKVVCWGYNGNGQAPTTPSADTFRHVSASASHTCGVRSDDKVVCWGYGGNGEVPSTLTTDTFKSVSTHAFHTCGVRSDGRIVCWGSNYWGEGFTTPSTETFDGVSTGRDKTCGVRAGDKGVCWGYILPNVRTATTTDSFNAISLGHYHTCGVRTDSRVVCWGVNDHGQAPTTPSVDTFKSVSAGVSHTCGVRTDGRVVCWGDNTYGQAPTTPSTDTFESVDAGEHHTCGVRTDGRVICWGRNLESQAPTAPSIDTFKSVSTGGSHTCGVRTDGRVVCWGDNTYGQAPNEPSTDTFKDVSAGEDHTCGVRTDGRVVCWGLNDFGEAPPL